MNDKTADKRPVAQEKPKPAVKKRTAVLAILFLIAVTAAIYSNSLEGKFLLDDDLLITDNAYVKSFVHIKSLFVSDLGKGIGIQSHYYRPLQVFTYMLIYHFWKFNVIPYHLLNLLLHILVVLCVYWMISLLYGDGVLSFFTALLYAVHPAHVESVSYISGTGDCMVALFTLLSFILYVKYVNTRNTGIFALLCAVYMIALFAKENSLILPALFLVYHYAFRKRVALYPFVLFPLVTAGYVAFRAAMLRGAIAPFQINTVMQRIPGFLAALTGYAQILIAPLNLYMGHESRFFSFSEPHVLAGAVILCAISWLALTRLESKEFGFFAFSWFFITLAPVSNLYPLTFYMADHYLYLPSIGFFLILAKWLRILYDNRKLRVYITLAVAALAAFYSYLTIKQNGYWKDAVTFYERTMRYAPDVPRTYVNMANYYTAQDEIVKAVELYEKALKVNPAFADAHHNLGVAYSKLGMYEEAEGSLKNAVKYNPHLANTYNMLGVIYSATGRNNDAVEAYGKGLELNPNNAKAINNLAALHYAAGDKEKTIELFTRAIKADPDYQASYTNLGIVYSDAGRNDEAIVLYKKALSMNPNDANTYNNLGNAYYRLGRKDEAAAAYSKCLSMKPGDYKALNNLAVVNADMGKNDVAVELLQEALELAPDYKDAKANLAVILSRQQEK